MLLDKVKRLEIECGDVIFLLRDTSAVDAMLGTYYRQYEEDGNIVVDEIKLYREVYNNDGLAISARQHIDFGNDYDYDYDYNSWVFELKSFICSPLFCHFIAIKSAIVWLCDGHKSV